MNVMGGVRSVMTTSGAVSGTLAAPGVTVFRGIPFAASTAGSRRWRPPAPPTPWEGVRSCAEFGPVCPQTNNTADWPMSEDCLNLNVWTPDPSPNAHLPNGEGLLPVLVWIFGGRFVWGAGRDPQFDGAAMAAKGMVVVTINYRLGVFGWLTTPELDAEAASSTSGNFGLLDQIAALRWVQANIAGFGGDPARVTIAGQSAGAASVMLLAHSPLARGLFRGVIALSGASHPGDPGLWFRAGSYRDMPTAQQQGAEYLAAHGAASIQDARGLPAEDLLPGNDADDPTVPGPHRPPLFRPVLDGFVIPSPYNETLTAGAQGDVAVMTGTVKDEDGASPHPSITVRQFRANARREYAGLADEFLALYPAATNAEAAVMSNQAANDLSRVSTYLWAQLWRRHSGNPVFTYFWTHTPPGPNADRDGAFHGGEIWYFLDSLSADASCGRPFADDDRRIAKATSDCVARFVATGKPGAWAEASQTTMELGDHFGPIPVATPARFDLHRRFLERRPQR